MDNINQYLGFKVDSPDEQPQDDVIRVFEDDKEYACESKKVKRDFRATRVKDKEDRATVEQCLDPRTRVILMKLLNNKVLKEINGCLSTGKEANVYHARGFESGEFAIKVYKTSILVFKDRDKYVSGEFRFRNGHCKSNPRKLIKLWAEKELRNLKRICQSNIPCPEPLFVKSNVLMMTFIGEDMVPAPRLRDAKEVPYEDVYLQLVRSMRVLHQECKLIHADLSEYNLLYFKSKLYFIDVSQSIEYDHPQAGTFLKRDIYNVNYYFKKKNVITFTLRQLYKFITDENITNVDAEIDKMIEERQLIEETEEDQEDRIFHGVHQPKDFTEVSDKFIQSEINKIKAVEDHTTDIQDLQNINLNVNRDIQKQEEQEEHSSSSQSSSQSSQVNSDDDISLLSVDESEGIDRGNIVGQTEKVKKKGGKQKYEGLDKKDRKHQIKEENKEKRKNKIPKSLKKFLTKRK